jgi:hypothetical protein
MPSFVGTSLLEFFHYRSVVEKREVCEEKKYTQVVRRNVHFTSADLFLI